MKRFGLGALFLGWLYGVPFLLIVGLTRRASTPYAATRAAAEAFGATTDRLLITAFVLNAAIPSIGLLLSRLAGERFWIRHFTGAIGGMVLTYLMAGVVAAQASTPLLNHVPPDSEPQPEFTGCIPRSGGHGCPGG